MPGEVVGKADTKSDLQKSWPCDNNDDPDTMSQTTTIDDPPTDAISSLRFSPTSHGLLVSSWDRTLSIYKRESGSTSFQLRRRIKCQAPLLDACWGADDSTAFAVGLDQDVRRFDLSNENDEECQNVLSTHKHASNKVAYDTSHNLLLSTSWDQTLHVHNLGESQGRAYIDISLKAKPFALALTSERAVVAMSERHISVYDLRALKMLTGQMQSLTESHDGEGVQPIHTEPWQERESSLKFMTRAVTTMPNGEGFVTSSIEGRVAVDWFDPSNQSKTYAFKCHRQTQAAVSDDGAEEDVDVVYPVNALAFNPVYSTAFVTAGGDGVVAVWDAVAKRRIRLYPKLEASIASVDFSSDGQLLAIAVSPGFEDGKEEVEMDPQLIKLHIREISEADMKGRAGK